MATFALVHGSWHDSWCWHMLTPLLQRAGHHVVAMDLPVGDASASFDDYADVVCAALDDCAGDVVLVGHSAGGATVPVVAARRPVRAVVYLCAFIPVVGKSLNETLRDDDVLDPACYAGLSGVGGQAHTIWTDLHIARAVMYADCDAAIADAALGRLLPQATYPNNKRFSLAEFPSVRSTYVVCNEDRLIRPEWSRRAAREQLGADVVELPGSHSPFLSRPSALADVLLGLAN